jgi:hypothetical protein
VWGVGATAVNPERLGCIKAGRLMPFMALRRSRGEDALTTTMNDRGFGRNKQRWTTIPLPAARGALTGGGPTDRVPPSRDLRGLEAGKD